MIQSNPNFKRFYVSPHGHAELSTVCKVNNCYSLQDVIDNQSYFFSSNAILELMAGKFEITESVGQLAIVDISNFSIIVHHQSFSDNNQTATFYCSRPGATFGFTFFITVSISLLIA